MAETQPPSGNGSRDSELYLRAVRPTDAPALSRICLLTGDAGQSAAPLHAAGELIGLVYAEPYAAADLPGTFGFVLVDPLGAPTANEPEGEGAVVGYVLGAYDTPAFEAAARETWFPRVRAAYPTPAALDADASSCALTAPNGAPLTAADRRYIRTLHAPPVSPAAVLARSPAHVHIDLLPAYQRRGWGRRMIARAVGYLREERGLGSLWLGIDVRNAGAAAFYGRLGFRELEGAPVGTLVLEFEDFV